MALTDTTRFIEVDFPNLNETVPAFIEALRHRGFAVEEHCLAGKVWELSLNKGSQLMQLMGLQVGLKLQIWPENGGVAVRMSPNLLTRQGIQAAALYIIWAPALLLPAWGLLQQYKLDEEILELLIRCLKHRPVTAVR
ncbi:MAG: hypothetical protein IJX33_07880 [Akkermansia sp.]|nr:hypothetical protein [Akkermansia sp.]MBQ8376949.1 hypothetical protein [Akkermansia sp.]